MKTLALRNFNGELWLTGTARRLAESDVIAAGFDDLTPITLVPTASLAPLLAREAYRVHAGVLLGDRNCGCMFGYLGDPAVSSTCAEGLRLASAIPTKKGTP